MVSTDGSEPSAGDRLRGGPLELSVSDGIATVTFNRPASKSGAGFYEYGVDPAEPLPVDSPGTHPEVGRQ